MIHVAAASKTVRNKNLILFGMCFAFTIWFAYDGFIGWPKANDANVQEAAVKFENKYTDVLPKLKEWPGQERATEDQRAEMYTLLHARTPELTFRQDSEIGLQKMIVLGLFAASLGAIGWFFYCQKRRATLDTEALTLSPRPGVVIPLAAIKTIDNTRWKKSGIVDITYTNEAGHSAETELDDYLLDGLPPLLNDLSTLAEKAELINPDAPPAPKSEG